MGEQNVPLIAFNRGLLSPLALSRIDIKRTAMSSEVQTNWVPRVLGSMMLRPGFSYTGGSYSNLAAIHIPFVFATTDKALLEFTDNRMRVKLAGTAITYPAISTSLLNTALAAYIANGTFDSGASWTAGAGWVIAAGVATATLSNAALTQTSGVTLINGKSYSITYTLTRSAGSVVATMGGTSGVARSSSATFTETIVAGASQLIGFTGTGFTGTVDVVSVTPINTEWVDTDEAGGTSSVTGGLMTFIGNGFASAIREQTVTISGPDTSIEHCLKIVVDRGPVTFSVGSATGTDDYVSRTTLGTGIHFLTFTPTGTFYVRFSSSDPYTKKVSYCQIFTGELGILTNWNDTDLQSMRWDQSADVVYIACRGVIQSKVERRSTRSWSVVNYEPLDGPFRVQNTTTIKITPSAVSGDITLTASSPLFKSTNVGSLYRLPSVGQQVSLSITGEDQFTDPIRVTGVGALRSFNLDLTGTWVGTISLQQSVGLPGSWVDVTTWTANTSTSHTDGLDNQIIYYRLGIKTGNYTSGTADVDITYASGSISGVVRVTAYSSATSVSAVVIKLLGGIGAVFDWAEGDWSTRRGTPSSVALHEGRLWWAGKSKIWGSISDAYESFDDSDSSIGDSGPILRSIGSGPVDNINFLLPLQRLILGTDGAEWPARSTSFDEPLTPSNFTLKSPSTQGSANVPAVKIDDRGLFVQKSGTKVFQMTYGVSADQSYSMDYTSANLCEIVPEIGFPGIIRMAVQRQPDTRVHCVRTDGRVAVLVSQPAEDVKCWLIIETDGMVEDAVVLPGSLEDDVYYLVRRRIGGATVRYLEKWAMETECKGGTVNKQADSFVYYNSTATTTLSGLGHLEGESVVCWGDGIYQGQYIVSSGAITVPVAVREAIVGKDYEGTYLSSKLAYAAMQGTALTKKKRVDHVGLIMADTHAQGLHYGSSLQASVNMFLYSDAFDNAVWTKTDSTISANAVVNPVDGATTADKLVEAATNAEHLVSQTANLRQQDFNTFSVYAKAGEQNYISLKMTGDAGTVSAMFKLSDGTVVASMMDNTGTGTSIRAKIESAGSGWYRCSITGVCDTAGTFGVLGTISLSHDGASVTYAGDITKGAYIFRAQIEPGKKMSDNIATTTRKAKTYSHLAPLPQVEGGRVIDQDEVWDQYDQPGVQFPGSWDTDSRMALVATAPLPVTVLAAVISVKTNG